MSRFIYVRASLVCCLVSCVASPDDVVPGDPAAVDELHVAPLAVTTVQFQRIGTPVCIAENVDGTPKLLEPLCNKAENRQLWSWISDSSGSQFIPRSAPLSCLDVKDASRASGAPIVVSSCGSDTSQHWLIFSTPRAFRIENANSHLCITRTVTASLFTQQPCDQNSVTQNFLLNTP